MDFDRMLDDAGKEAASAAGSGIERKTLRGAGKVALGVAATGIAAGVTFSVLKKAEAKEDRGNLTNPYDSSVASNISSYRYGKHIG